MNVTKKYLEGRVAHLAKLIKAPLIIRTWSPGDGWTRYQLQDGSERPFFNEQYFTRAEFLAVINAAILTVFYVKDHPEIMEVNSDDRI